MKIVLATKNIGKLKEFTEMATQTDLEFQAFPKNITFPQETGLTFAENAFIKAHHAFLLTGIPSLGDDSGLEVDCLKGRPGIFSSRFSQKGTDISNMNKLLKEMEGRVESKRSARFRCSLVFIKDNNEEPLIAEGLLEGTISKEKRGNKGFGYDPIFIPKGLTLHMSELESKHKNAISHRAKAFKLLLKKLI